jgi:DNA-binding transcriptional MerR regulator
MPFKTIASMSQALRLLRAGFGAASAARVPMEKREAEEFDRLEQEYPQGLSAAQIVDFFAPRGVKLAQATFRKYVQLGLLPRSRRVGEKGKHRGSRGLYPASAARRIHLIKHLMDEGKTLEEIRGSFVFFRGQLDGVERSLDELFAALEKSIAERAERKPSRRKELERLVTEGRRQAKSFVEDMERTVTQITARDETGKGDR